ncbi:MAG: hypothetical protein P1Q69_04130 [Candidatus Thorarchaeota archaeon]|nr:hypothetical protein [Candidatus Thorarchaeota archaeon]
MDNLLPPEARKNILQKITPTQSEIDLQREVISELRESLKNYADGIQQSYSFIEPQGSTGKKQTQLRGTSDIDLFVALEPDDYKRVLSLPNKQRDVELDKALEKMIDNWFIPTCKKLNISKFVKTYSQHPYLTFEFRNNNVDLLICFDLSKDTIAASGPITAVDRTVHHSNFVAERIDAKLREDIRILKSFTRASYAYGDVCAVGQMGFTGYSLELLVLFKGGLRQALKALQDLSNTPLDPLNRPLSDLTELPAFRDNLLFIIDPTDTNRNVASSFSERSYKWLRKRIMDLFEIPTEKSNVFIDMIIEKPISTNEIPSWFASHSYVFEFQSDGSLHYTVLRDKIHRLARRIATNLEKERTGEERFGKTLYEVFFEEDRYALGFVMEQTQASETYSRRGPPISIPEADNFRKAHPQTYERDGYLWVDETRKWIDALQMIDTMIAKNPVKGLAIEEVLSDVGRRVLNILLKCALPVEPDFQLKAIV